jgi:hypothetical protein
MMHGAIGHNSADFGEEMDDRAASVAAKEFWAFVDRIRASDLPAHTRHAAIEIWLHMRPGKMRADPSVARIAQHTGLSERTIQSDIKRLRAEGFFDVEFSKGGRSQRHTFIAKRIAETAQELRGLMDQNPAVVTPFRRNTPQGMRRLDGQNPAGRAPFNAETPQEMSKNPAGRAPEATLEATKKEKRGDAHPRDPAPRDGPFGKVAAAIAAGFAGAVTPVAAMPPVDPPAQVIVEAAECWQTPRARMDASLNPHERGAQFQVWVTPTGLVEVTGEFRDELAKEYPLVDLKCGLAAAAANVNAGQGAINAMRTIRRQFGFMQQDAARKEKSAASRAGEGKSRDQQRRESAADWMRSDIAQRAQRGVMQPRLDEESGA